MGGNVKSKLVSFIIFASTLLIVCTPQNTFLERGNLFSVNNTPEEPVKLKQVFKQLVECRVSQNPPMECCMFHVFEDEDEPYIEMMCIGMEPPPTREATITI